MDYSELVPLVEEARLKSQRKDPITLIAVSKHQPIEKILDAYNQGCRVFGESRVQEWELKRESLPKDIEWHFIGTLQKNKVRKVVPGASLIHSVDSISLAQKIAEVSQELNVNTKILLEVNTSGEATKHGFSKEEIEGAVEAISLFPCISIEGLMTIGPNTEDESLIRKAFRELREIKESLVKAGYPLKALSMGMSHDYPIAIKEGATLIRVGTLLFGER